MNTKILSLFLFSIVFLFFSEVHAANTECTISEQITIPAKKKNGKAIEAVKLAYRLNDGSIIYLGRFTIDADGHPKAYHSDKEKGLDYLANGGYKGNWWALATDDGNCGKTGNPIIQGSNDPSPGFYVTKTTMTKGVSCTKQRNYVHSGEIPFVAVSPKIQRYDFNNNSGNLFYIENIENNKSEFALFSDIAPKTGIGEGSMYLAEKLGYASSPKNGGTHKRENIFLMFNEKMKFPKDVEHIRKKGGSAFLNWGGKNRLEKCKIILLKKKRDALKESKYKRIY